MIVDLEFVCKVETGPWSLDSTSGGGERALAKK